MKEFSAQTGGRYTYVDDIINLQELALAFGELFDECDNFIVSGCAVSGTSIGSGYVYLNGKLRYFSGATGITQWPQYIYETNKKESVAYASGSDKVGRTIYGCACGPTVPVSVDEVTGNTPVALSITQSGGLLMKDAFVGKYALLLNPAKGTQTVNGIVKFANDINISGLLTALADMEIRSGNTSCRVGYNSSHNLTIKSTTANGNNYSVVMKDGVGIEFYVNGTLKMTIGDDITFHTSYNTNASTMGSIKTTGTHVHNSSTATDNGELNLNMIGYNGGNTYFRNTYIGNGKGKAIISVKGSDSSVLISGVTTIASNGLEGIVLLASLPKTNMALQKSVIWKDSNKDVMASIGYLDTANQIFSIVNNVSDIVITGASSVSIGPVIKEDGVLLSQKYALSSAVNKALSLKANIKDVYSASGADNTFAKKASGFSQFITSTNTQAKLRSQIGALGSSDLNGYAVKSQCLADMATSEANKKKIRDNIGAAAVGDFQTKLRDSGWIMIKSGLYVRQIGNIVSVQGNLRTVHSGTVFSIPNSIDPPAHAVYQSCSFSNNRNWTVSIKANTRQCKVIYCSGSCGNTTDFSLTYMV